MYLHDVCRREGLKRTERKERKGLTGKEHKGLTGEAHEEPEQEDFVSMNSIKRLNCL